jgi:cytochrome P450
LKRGPDGKFADEDIAKILQDATASPGGQYRARGTPAVMRIVEILGIEQARNWGCCSMNEFRKFLGLKEFESFEEWNPDPDIAGTARRLYKHIDNLELYTGLQCESTMPLTPGLRFSCGYTMTKAVLSDAIALVRGDRFNTTSFTSETLTSWGINDCRTDPHNGGWSGEVPKLLMRHLPRFYPFNNVYGVFPFFTPTKMKESLTRLGIADRYTFDRPVPTRKPVILNTFTGINVVFNAPTKFRNVYDMKKLGDGYGCVLAMDDNPQHDADKAVVMHALFPTKDSIASYAQWYREMTAKQIKEKSWKYDGVPGMHVDIVKDVINTVSVHWSADRLCGIPLKTKDNPRGLYTVQEVYDMFTTLFELTFWSFGKQENGFSLRFDAIQAGGVVQGLVAKSIAEVAPQSSPNFLLKLANQIGSFMWPPTRKPCYEFFHRLAASGRPINQLTAFTVGVAIGSSVSFAQSAVHVIDFYLDPRREKEFAHIVELIRKTDQQSAELLLGYVYEGMRLNPQFTSLWRQSTVDVEIPQGADKPPIQLKAGDLIFSSFRNAHLNPVDFPNPTKVDPTRPRSSYNLNGTGFHECIAVSYSVQSIAEIVKVIFGLKNLRRAAGDAGRLVGFTEIENETEVNVYLTSKGTTSAWPGSMHLVYDV